MIRRLALLSLLIVSACATVEPQRTGVNYSAEPPRSMPPAPSGAPTTRADEGDWRAAGSGQDAAFERSALLTDTFYRNVDALLQQVERSGAMGVNRGWEAGARKGGEWYIEEQRFGDTVIGAGVNRNRVDLIDAGLRAFEWGFQQQAQDGSFASRDNYVSTAYFVAGVAHGIWLLETTGHARDFSGRIATMRPKLAAAARWLANANNLSAARPAMEQFNSRYFLTGYALGAAARVTGELSLAAAGDQLTREGIAKQNAAGFFTERGGFDVSFQGEALVYLLRYHDHVANADARRVIEPSLRRALAWTETRVNGAGVIQVANNTRTGANQERDRTGQPRRVSAVAVSRAFGLARFVIGEARYETLARTVATARQP